MTARRSRLRRIAALVALATGILLGAAYLIDPADRGPRYKAEAVSRTTLELSVMAAGQLGPRLRAEVGSQISGIVQEVRAQHGTSVTRGQVLARLDPVTYAMAAREAEVGLVNSQLYLELVRTRAAQADALGAQGLISGADHDEARTQLRQAEGAAEIAGAALERARLDVDRCAIRAPLEGIVISRNIEVGQSVSAGGGSTPLFVIAHDLRQMQVEANVMEADIGAIRPGQRATITVSAHPESTFDGTVTEVRSSPIADQNVVTYPTIVSVDNPELLLRPGMTANVSIVVARREGVLTIPNAALRFRPARGVADGAARAGDTAEVYRWPVGGAPQGSAATEPGAVSIRTGLTDGRRTEVLEGLSEGDRIVLDLERDDADQRSFLGRIPGLFLGDTRAAERRSKRGGRD